MAAVGRREPGIQAGTLVGRYAIEQPLGIGGMGETYVASDTQTGQRVAIKLIHRELAGTHHRLITEGPAIMALRHPNLVGVLDIGYADDRPFIVMELVIGQNLRSWLRQPHSLQQVLAIMNVAGRALGAVHAAHLVHRDFKPENVLIRSDGAVLVSDFAVTRAATDYDAVDVLTNPEAVYAVTPSGAFVGTPRYMAPEQFLGDGVDARSDQFGFCATLYEALHHRPAFQATAIAELRAAIAEGRMPQFGGDGVPAFADAVIERGLAGEPEQRFPSMDGLLAALVPPVRRRSLPLVIAGSAVAVGIVGAIVAAKLGKSSGPGKLVVGAETPVAAGSGALALLPDGRIASADRGELAVAARDGSGRQVLASPDAHPVLDLAPGGQPGELVVTTQPAPGKCSFWLVPTATGKPRQLEADQDCASRVTLAGDRDTYAVARDHHVAIVSLGTNLERWRGPELVGLTSLAWSSGGDYLAIVDGDGLRVIDRASHEVAHDVTVRAAAWIDARRIATLAAPAGGHTELHVRDVSAPAPAHDQVVAALDGEVVKLLAAGDGIVVARTGPQGAASWSYLPLR